MAGIGPGAIQNHGPAVTQTEMGLTERSVVDRVDIFRAVEALAEEAGIAVEFAAAHHVRTHIVGGDRLRSKVFGQSARQGGLSGSRTTADKNQRNSAGPKVVQRNGEMASCIGGGLGMALVVADTVNLGSHHCAVRDVEVSQR